MSGAHPWQEGYAPGSSRSIRRSRGDQSTPRAFRLPRDGRLTQGYERELNSFRSPFCRAGYLPTPAARWILGAGSMGNGCQLGASTHLLNTTLRGKSNPAPGNWWRGFVWPASHPQAANRFRLAISRKIARRVSPGFKSRTEQQNSNEPAPTSLDLNQSRIRCVPCWCKSAMASSRTAAHRARSGSSSRTAGGRRS